MTERKTVYLLDSTAQIYRAYYAVRGLTSSTGMPTNAVFGFTNVLNRLIKKYRPELLGAAFDVSGPTFRHEMYEQYKANRPEMPDDLKPQIPYIMKICEYFNIPVICHNGFEADDIIGTLAKKAEAEGYNVIIVSPDKDLLQLVTDNTWVMNPSKDDRIFKPADVEEVFGVKPEGVVDVLAIWGDSSDNIPGVPGIGEKGAKQIIGEFGSIENALKNIDNVANRYKHKLKENSDVAFLSRKLATINRDMEITFEPKSLKTGEPNRKELFELFTELNFKSMLHDYMPDSETTEKDYRLIKGIGEVKELVKKVEEKGFLSIDLETTSKTAINASIVGISVSLEEYQGCYIPVGHREGDNLKLEEVLKLLKPVLENSTVLKIGQNLKYEYTVFKRYGVNISLPVFDTMIAAYLLKPSSSGYSLDALASEYLMYKTIKFDEVTGEQGLFAETSLKEAVNYACEDADVALRLKNVFFPELEQKNLLSLFNDIEMPLVGVLASFETRGIRLDCDYLFHMSNELAIELERVRTEIFKEAGTEFNINSPKQVGEILFDKLGLKPVKKTKKSKTNSTSVEVLEQLAWSHDVPKLILEHRSLTKLKSTYVDALPKMVNSRTGRLHTSFNQCVTATGRLSSSNPNLQNIPIRTERGRQIRKAFVADNEHKLIAADYSQIELRLLAHLSGDKVMIDAFSNNEDIHARTASEIFGMHPELITKEMRYHAKTINFGVIYGMGAFSLAKQIGVDVKTAKSFIDSYFKRYSGVKDFMDKAIETARVEKKVETLFGRKRYFSELGNRNGSIRAGAERAAFNTIIQGTAADLMKMAMISVNRFMTTVEYGYVLLQVHDELVVEVPEKLLEKAVIGIKEEMECVYKLKVPLIADVKTGANWLEME